MLSKIGLEAEFLLLDTKGEVIIPPSSWDRDGFPLLGEIRADPASNTPDVIANFIKKKMKIEAEIYKDHKIVMENIRRIRLATYKEAMKQVTEAKGEQLGKVKNIYGINIDDYSDQVVGKNHKIQGINASCGLHIHFSCNESVTKIIKDVEYDPVILPIKLAKATGENVILTEMIKPEIWLYRKKYLSIANTKKITATASVLTKPVIECFVKEMDKMFFDRFAPKKEDRTKYRQPGFYELKPYGFEYRSLPANDAVMEALPEIVSKAFDLFNLL
jgi:hypothetical protein